MSLRRVRLQGHSTPLQVNCASGIFLCSAGVPWIQQEGVATVENLRRQIAWNGDLNFYDGIDAFWLIRSSIGETPADLMTFGTWLSYWGPSRENRPMFQHGDWKRLPDPDRPVQPENDGRLRSEPQSLSKIRPSTATPRRFPDAGVQASRLLPP